MRLLNEFWSDENGVLLSAEAVVVGTVAVVGMTAGMSVVATSVSEELKDVASSIRSLDQSYSIPAQESCGARTAGSSFTQAPVQESLDQLCEVFEKAEKAEKKEKSRAERMRKQLKKQKAEGSEESEALEELDVEENAAPEAAEPTNAA
jgi:septation ring formation regulator EzrA